VRWWVVGERARSWSSRLGRTHALFRARWDLTTLSRYSFWSRMIFFCSSSSSPKIVGSVCFLQSCLDPYSEVASEHRCSLMAFCTSSEREVPALEGHKRVHALVVLRHSLTSHGAESTNRAVFARIEMANGRTESL